MYASRTSSYLIDECNYSRMFLHFAYVLIIIDIFFSPFQMAEFKLRCCIIEYVKNLASNSNSGLDTDSLEVRSRM